MPKDNKTIEIRILEAVNAIDHGIYATIASAARAFDVPYHRLRRRAQGGKSLFERPLTGRRLNEAQGASLKSWTDYRDSIGAPPKRSQVLIAASNINIALNPSAAPLSDKWVRHFLQHNPHYHIHRRKAFEI
ncbi:hypothetical protein N7493_001205 [Penicillium malachiteum]|uniref:HTH CENPB-type domain-containing protein n=1 Tax=Penicillium malachiteum TaxID=1324776 RepID=A0AAD6HUQ3_9EURO|nr:hypothetical protein N7493_001205 [Penicillium malachiteum]